MEQLYAFDRDKGQEGNPAIIGCEADKIDWSTEKFVCWQPDELDNAEFNLVMYCPKRDIVFRGRSFHFDFMCGKNVIEESKPKQKKEDKNMDKAKVLESLVEYLETRLEGCLEALEMIEGNDCLDNCDRQNVSETIIIGSILKKIKKLSKDEVTQ